MDKKIPLSERDLFITAMLRDHRNHRVSRRQCAHAISRRRVNPLSAGQQVQDWIQDRREKKGKVGTIPLTNLCD